MSDGPQPAATPPPLPEAGRLNVVGWWRSPWFVWNLLAIALVAVLLIHFNAPSRSELDVVRGSRLANFGDEPLGEVLDHFMNEPRWEAVTGDDGLTYVTAAGRVHYLSKSSLATIRFRVDPERESIRLVELAIDGEIKTPLVGSDFLRKAYASYEPALLRR